MRGGMTEGNPVVFVLFGVGFRSPDHRREAVIPASTHFEFQGGVAESAIDQAVKSIAIVSRIDSEFILLSFRNKLNNTGHRFGTVKTAFSSTHDFNPVNRSER